MNKLIKLQDKFILVSDEEIKEGDFVLAKDTNIIFQCNEHEASKPIKQFKELYFKIIAGIPELPAIDFSLLSEEDSKKIGWVDVDYKLEDFEFERKKVYLETGSLTACTILDRGISLGFKTAQSLNDKMFSLEDVEKAIDMAREGIRVTRISEWETEKEFDYTSWQIIQSLQQISWDVEVNELNQVIKIL